MIILPSGLSTSFVRNVCWLNNGNTHPPALCAGEAPDEKPKINELGPNLTYADTCIGYVTITQPHLEKLYKC